MLEHKDAIAVAEAVTKIERSMETIVKLMTVGLKQAGSDAKDLDKILEEMGSKALHNFTELKDRSQEVVDLNVNGWTKAMAVVDDFGKKATDALKGIGLEIKELEMLGNPLELLFELLKQGFTSINASTTESHRVLNQFSGTSTQTAEQFAQLEHQIQMNKVAVAGLKDSLGPTAQSLAQFGVSSAEAMSKMKGGPEGSFGSVVNEAMAALDQLGNLGQGGAGKFVGQMAQTTGEDVSKLTNQMFQLRDATRDTGANFGQLLGTLAQASASLRLQRQDVDGLKMTYVGLYDAMQRANPGAQNKEVNAAGAMSAMTGLAHGLAGMGDGLKALLMTRQGQTGTPFEMLYKYDTASSGKDSQNFMLKNLSEIRKLGVETMGSKKEDLYGFFQKLPGLNLSKEAALALANIDPAKLIGMSKDQMKNIAPDIADAIDKANAQKDPMQQLMEVIKASIEALGALILSGIAALVNTIITAMSALGQILSNPLHPFEAAKKADAMMNQSAEDIKNMMSNRFEEFSTSMGAFALPAGTLSKTWGTGRFTSSDDERVRKRLAAPLSPEDKVGNAMMDAGLDQGGVAGASMMVGGAVARYGFFGKTLVLKLMPELSWESSGTPEPGGQ